MEAATGERIVAFARRGKPPGNRFFPAVSKRLLRPIDSDCKLQIVVSETCCWKRGGFPPGSSPAAVDCAAFGGEDRRNGI
jgi:hypothetical protein